jgi:hypothetical protein
MTTWDHQIAHACLVAAQFLVSGRYFFLAAAKQPRPQMIAHLHYDIFCAVVRFLENDRHTLFNCSLVNKDFNFVASQILYHTIVIDNYTNLVSFSS